MKHIVYSHKRDLDGLFSALYVQISLELDLDDSVEIIWIDSPDDLPSQLIGKLENLSEPTTIHIGDLSVSPIDVESTLSAIKAALDEGSLKGFNMVDHHSQGVEFISSLGKLEDERISISYFTGRCAAYLTYLKYEDVLIDKYPLIVDRLKFMVEVVNDRDLWLHQMPESARYQSILELFGLEKLYDEMLSWIRLGDWMVPSAFESNAVNRIAVARQEQKEHVIDRHMKNYVKIESNGRIIGLTFTHEAGSEIGNRMCMDGCDIGVCVNMMEAKISMRSIKYNVGKIAAQYGGGGHDLAASFKIKNLENHGLEFNDIIIGAYAAAKGGFLTHDLKKVDC